MQAILWPIVVWLVREIVVKFLVFSAILAVCAWLMPHLLGYFGNISGASLTESFGGLPSGVIYFLRIFAVPQGLTIILSAYVARFLIRRLPVIG